MKALSPRHQAILRAIRSGNGRQYAAIGQAVGLASTNTVYYHLCALNRAGYVRWAPEKQGTLTLTGKGLLAAQGYELIYACDQDGIHEVG